MPGHVAGNGEGVEIEVGEELEEELQHRVQDEAKFGSILHILRCKTRLPQYLTHVYSHVCC